MADCRMRCPLLVGTPSYTTQEWVVFGSAPQRVISLPGDSGSFFVAQTAIRQRHFPVACIMFGGAYVTWLQQMAGDGSLAPVEEEGLRSPAEYRDDLFYHREIAIVVPATRVLRWLAEARGGEYEFGDEVD